MFVQAQIVEEKPWSQCTVYYFPNVCAETGSLISQPQDKPEAKFSSVKEPALLNLEELSIRGSIHLPSLQRCSSLSHMFSLLNVTCVALGKQNHSYCDFISDLIWSR